MRQHLIVPAFALFGFVSFVNAATINVPEDQPTIQAGIVAANDGDVVIVAPGRYCERNVDFLGKGITVRSVNPSDPDMVAATIVDGLSYQGSIFVIKSEEDSTTVLQGFTITGGWAINGGGVFINYSTPQVLDCVVEWNYGSVGGGIFSTLFANPTVERCTIRNNASQMAGGVFVGGSGAYRHCSIVDNYADWNVGGIEFGGRYSATMENCIVARNTSNVNGGQEAGLLSWAMLSLSNCTLADNQGAGAYVEGGGELNLTNCISWGSGEALVVAGGEANAKYSLIEGGWPGEGNIDADPRFATYKGFDYVLGSGSPAIDAGAFSEDEISDWHPRWPARYPNGPRSDMGAYGGPNNGAWAR